MQSVIVSIEDDRDVAEYIQKILTDAGFTVHVAHDAPRGLSLIESVNPDLVLLDLHLPTVPGDSVLSQLRADYPLLPIVMLTVENDPHQVAKSLNLGAEDYIPKPFSPEVLIARVKARLRHNSGEQHLLKIADLEMDTEGHQVRRNGKEIELTPQEFKLLHFLMSHPNQVLSRESILSRIWATSPDIETRVVDVYIGYLRKKIDHKSDNALIHSIRSFGYILKDSSGDSKSEKSK